MKLSIKYMTTPCCKQYVVTELEKMGFIIISFNSIEVFIKGNISDKQLTEFRITLLKLGLDLIVDKNAILTEKIKLLIIEKIHSSEDTTTKIVFSTYLSKILDLNYSYISDVFSNTDFNTIEHYIINHKIERVKEQLNYNELSISQISYKFNYSSVAHLSSQFKKVTGITPTFFKNLKNKESDKI